MPSVFFDYADLTDEIRRERVYEGNIFLNSPVPSMIALCEFARSLIEEAFPNGDPRLAQFNIAREDYVEIIGPLKSKFTNHIRTKELLRDVLTKFGYDLDKTYFDVPRLRIATHGAYLTAGVGYAYRPHRDTWYAGAPSQVNWWVPIYPLKVEQALIFYPGYFDRAVRNSSNEFDYDEWCRVGRQQAASQIEVDTRKHPLALEELPASSELRLVCDGASAISFSCGQLHATAPNTSGATRFSLDFRTIHLDDFKQGKGAFNVDAAATGTTAGDHIRASDFSGFPVELLKDNSRTQKS